ncbi:protein MAIN-LIKE 2-like [Papaver somniferum]|uniref:protein MAIN-LIKE 2-like n=1 Tax=Papaver somniferum TaxID=3469 RepID=UPI000E6F9523|nr:protein MAIN-LIKE 2-like [Papaver somniferum]
MVVTFDSSEQRTKLRQQVDEDLKNPTPRGEKHLDFRKRGTTNAKHGGGLLPEVNQDNVRDVIQDVDPTYGTPNDGGATLFGYKHSWAAKIYATKDHKDAVRVIKRQKASKWDLSKECAEFQAKVKECVLYKTIELVHADFDAVAVSAFLERHYPETYTMHLPFGEMAITPDDFHNITGLPLEGKCLREGYNPSMSYEALEALAQKCLGWDARKSQCEFRRSVRSPKKGDEYNAYEANGAKKKTVKKFKLVKLKEAFSETKTKGKLVMDAETLRHHVTAYWLYMLGTVIFPDTSRNRVDAHYLQLLEDLDEMNNYSWATGVLAFVLEEMSKGSRIRCNQIGGYLTLVKVWIYDHFPKLGLGS